MSPVLRKTTSDMLSFAPCPIRLAVCLLFAMPAAHALPSGATPTSGQTTVQQTSPKQLDIRQTTPRAGLDWTSFSIAAGERVLVSQPGRDSVLLNRVIGNDPSQILGSLQANGSVWLINPRGIVFGAGSQVDVGGLLASTLSLGELGGGSSNADFAAGRLSLGRTGNTPGSLRSEGSIRAPGGSVVLVAPQLSQGGSIEARRIGLAAATHVNVDVEGDGLIFFNARNDGSLDARLAQLGRLTADGGTAEMRAAARAGFADTVLNMDGVVQARSIGQRNGRVVIDGGRDGVTVVNGQVDVSGTAASGETGGQAQVLGQRVALTGNAVVDASGNAGGGAIRVGGDYQGHNPDLPNAQYTLIQPGASLRADAVAKGQGGSVIVWSDEGTRFLGNISARGGAQGGDGGFAEVSGKLGLDFRGLVDLTAARGQAGTLLLDPHDLTIQDSDPNLAGTADVDLSTATLAFNFPSGPVSAGVDGVQPTDVNSVITKGALNTQLNLAAVSLQAHNNITVAAPTNPPAGSGTATTISGPNSLTLQAGGTINIAASISTNGLTLSANDPGAAKTITTGSVITSAPLNAGTGNLSISNNPDGTGSHEIGADLSGATFSIVGNINLVANSTWTLGSGTSTIAGAIGGTGALTKAGAGSLTLGGVNTYTGATTVTEGELVLGRVNAINPASALVVTGGTLNLGANNNTVASVSLQGGTITGTDGVLTSSTNFDVQSGTVSAILDGAAVAAGAPAIGLTKTGAATSTVTLSRANLYSGATNVNGGTLAVGANGHLASTAIDVNAATATLALASGAAVNQLNDAAVVTVTSGGRFTVGSATTIQQLDLGGTLDGAGSLNATTSTALTGGTVSAQLATPALSSTGASAILASVSANTTTVTAGTLRISDPGTLDTPLLNLDNGSLTTVGNQRLTNPNSAVTIANGATLTLDGNESIGALADKTGQVDGTATVNLVGATSTLTLNNTTTFGGKISGSAGSTLVNAGANTLTVGATGQFNPGAIDLDAGSLSTTVNEQIGNTTRVNLVQGATLTLGGNETIGALSDKASATATGTASVDLGSHTLSVNTTPDTLATTFSGVISGVDGQLTKTGLGSLTLGGVNTYSGLTTVTGGTLAVGANGRLASTAINIDAATATLALASGAAVNQLNDTATVTVTNSGRFTVGSATTIQQLKLGGTLDGAGSLNASSSAALTDGSTVSAQLGTPSLSSTGSSTIQASVSANTTTVTAGTLRISDPGTLDTPLLTLDNGSLTTVGIQRLTNAATAVTIANGATLTLGGNESIGALADKTGQVVDGTATVDLGAASTLTLNTTTATTFGGKISGTAGSTLLMAGANTLTVGATGQFNPGAIDLNAGTLVTTANEQIGNATRVNLAQGATLRLSGNETIGALSDKTPIATTSTASVDLGNHTLSVNTAPDTLATTFSGVISGVDGQLTKTGPGSLTLGGVNTYSGATNVNGGTLAVGANGRLASTAINIDAATATLALASGAAVNQLNDTATVTVTNSGRFTVGSATTIQQLKLGGTLDGAGSLNASSSAALTDGSTVSAQLGTPSLSSTGSSTIQASVSASTTTVTAGTLTLGSTVTPGSKGSLSSDTIDVDAGSLVTTANEQLSDTARISLVKGATLTLGGNETIGGLSDKASLAATGTASVVLGGNTLNVSITGADSSTFSGVISSTAATGSLVKDGTGNLTLLGANTYAGTTTVKAGTLTLGSTVTPGSKGSLSSSTIDLDAGTLSTTTNEQIGNATRVNLAQGATLTLGGNETIGALSDKASPTATGTASVDLGSHTLRVNTTPDTLATTFSGVISGVDGQLTKTGAGSLTLGGVNTYTGSTTVSAGELALGTSNALNSASTLVVNGGTLNLGSNSSTVAGVSLQGGTLTGTSGVLASASAFDVRSGTVDAILDGASGAATAIGLTKTGTGTVTLNRANLYRGQTTISAGELALGTGNAINAASTLVVNGGTLNLGANANTVAGVSLQGGTLTGTSGVLTSASTFDVRSGSVDAILDGVSGATTAIGLTKTGAGTVTLNRANLYEGQTTVSAGVLALGTANAINPASTVVINGGTLNLGTNANTVAGVSLQGGTIAGTSGVLTSASTFDVQSGSVNAILDGVVAAGTPAIGLTKTGTGTVTLSRNNAYQGTTTVSDGRLALGTVNAIHPSGRLIVNGGTLDLGANASTLAGVSLQLGTITGTSGVLTSASTFDIQSGSVNAILDGVAVAAGTPAIGLAKTGASTAALNRANLYRGQTTISAGELALGTGNAINAASVLVVNGGTLNLGGNANTVAGVSLQGGTLTGTSGVLTSASTFDVRSGSVDAILAGAAVAAGAPAIGLSKTSAGTVTLNRANLYRGQTTVSAGELALGTGNAINPAGTLVVNGGTLNLGTNANTVAGVSLQSGSLTGTGGVLTSTTDFDVRSGSVSAVLAGSTPRIGLTKTTGGSVTLSAANTFTGTTDVSAGTLNLNHGSALANSAVSMGNTAGAVLNLLTDASVGSLSGGGASGGQVTLGTHTLSTGANNSSTTYSGVIAGSSGAVTKVGNGTLTLDSANTYGGHTLVNAGILAVAHASALGSATGVASGTSVADGAVLALGSVVLGGESLQLQGSGINNAGALVVTGTSRLDGPVVLAGSTTIGSKNALLINGLLSTAANVNGPVTLTKIDAGDLTVAGAGSSLGTSSSKGNLDVKDGRVILATPVQNVGTLSVASQKTLQLGRDASATDQTADTLDLSGNLTGTGVLTAGNYKLTNATVEVDLGPGNLTASGASQLAGTAAVGSATVADGTLTLGSAGRFTADPTVQVNSNATLITKGAESLASLNAAGSVNLGGDLTTSGDMRFSGAVTMDEQKGMTLTSGQRIEALNDGNRWGNSLTVTATGPVNLFAGRDAAGARTLTLGTLSLAQGGSINAGVLNLDGNVTVSGGVLQLVASAAATPAGDIIPAELQGKQTPAPEATLTPRQIVFASDVVRQQDGTRVLVSPGAQLKIQASGGGSVKLASVDNNFAGGLEVISGTANSAWTDRAFNPVINGRSEARSLQGRVQVNATELNVAGAGLEADVISLTSDSLTTAAGSVIAARLPYDPQGGPSRNLPALTLITTDAAHSQANGGRAPYGVGGGGEIAINVGNKAWATATRSGPNSGFVSVQRPGGNSAGSSALSVVLTGPQVGAGAYTFFTLGAGQDGSIPVFYNGLGTLTASEALAVGSTVSVAESARKERFDDAVRTENVAVRLRQGVIAEVGPGRPATQGSDGLRPPLPCQPASLSLSCEQ